MDVAPSRLFAAVEEPGNVAIGEIVDKPVNHGAHLFGREAPDGGPYLGVVQISGWRGSLEDSVRGEGMLCLAAVMIQRLVPRNRKQPATQVIRALQAGIGSQGCQECLLEAIVGFLVSDGCHQESIDRLAVSVEQVLKGRQPHVQTTFSLETS